MVQEMATASTAAGGALPSPQPLRVLRILAGESWTVRFLASKLRGMGTHWHRGLSVPCFKKECPSDVHKTPFFWKGYAPVIVWQPKLGNWLPTVLEVTENLELDLREHDLFGQEWTLSRAEQVGKKRTPVVGELVQTLPREQLPKNVHKVEPCLQHLYHTIQLPPHVPNELPSRPVVEIIEGPPPMLPAIDQERPLSGKEVRAVLDQARARLRDDNGNGNGNGKSNGKH